MRAHRLDQLTDADLTQALHQVVSHERAATAAVLAHIAEFDARKLYAPAGYACMRDYCVARLQLSEGAAYRRITAARAARQFPMLFDAIADGRVHLSAVTVLSPHLSEHNVAELVALATHRSKAEVEGLVAARFPRSESMALVCEVAPSAPRSLFPGRVAVREVLSSLVPGRVNEPAPRVAPVAAQRFVIQVTVSEQTHAKLEQLRALMSHAIPGGELADVLDYALSMAIARVEKRKFGTTDQPRTPRASTDPRHIPAHVRRAVHARDGGRCTFVADDGHRCDARSQLEFDHVEPVARDGASTVDNLRLRCRAHNQLAAEQAFGAGFMHEKRDAARVAEEAAERIRTEADHERLLDVVAALRTLGCRAERARHIAERSNAPGLDLEQHVRAALRLLSPTPRKSPPLVTAA